jgi:hypothetical protein
MDTEIVHTYTFENGRFTPYPEAVTDSLQWSDFLAQRGYTDQEQVWGDYPDAYIKVYEAAPRAQTEFQFVAILNLVALPHHVFLRDLNSLVQLLTLLMPLFKHHSRPDADTGEALFGSQGAQEEGLT